MFVLIKRERERQTERKRDGGVAMSYVNVRFSISRFISKRVLSSYQKIGNMPCVHAI